MLQLSSTSDDTGRHLRAVESQEQIPPGMGGRRLALLRRECGPPAPKTSPTTLRPMSPITTESGRTSLPVATDIKYLSLRAPDRPLQRRRRPWKPVGCQKSA